MANRVAITGMGCVTPLGLNPQSVWDGLTHGRSGVGPLTLFDASHFPVRIAAEVPHWDVRRAGEDVHRWERCPRQTQFVMAAGTDAMQAAGLSDVLSDRRRMGVYLGCGECFQDFLQFTGLMTGALREEGLDEDRFISAALRIWRPDVEQELEPNMPAAHLAARFDLQGPNLNCIAACASAAQAIGESAEMIRRGEVDAMLAGGAHSMIHPFGISGFERLSALSQRNDDPAGAVRPFDRDRDGFVVGEGSAMFVLESLDHALARGAEIYGELIGYGSAQDAFRITDSHPDGRGAVLAMRRALDDAQLNPEAVDYINAHGTGTVVNDKVESRAIKQVFGLHAYGTPISSTKSMLGHFTTAGGAIELLVCLKALNENVVPPTINLCNRDPDCDLDYVANEARQVACQYVMSNSFGFGGQNAVLVAARYTGRTPACPSRRAA